MKQLTEVSETALITLRSRAMESQKENSLIQDSLGEVLLQKIRESLPPHLRPGSFINLVSGKLLNWNLTIRASEWQGNGPILKIPLSDPPF